MQVQLHGARGTDGWPGHCVATQMKFTAQVENTGAHTNISLSVMSQRETQFYLKVTTWWNNLHHTGTATWDQVMKPRALLYNLSNYIVIYLSLKPAAVIVLYEITTFILKYEIGKALFSLPL